MIKCDYCGRENHARLLHCHECGTPLRVIPPVIEQTRFQSEPAAKQPRSRAPLSPAVTRAVKRLSFAFGLVMVIHAFLAFGPHWWIPPRFAEMLYLALVWIAPATVYLVALYGLPTFPGFDTGALRLARVALLTLVAFGLSFGSAMSFLAFWFVLSLICGFPFREA